MKLRELAMQRPPPVPWAEGDNIPWSDPDFSRRMLDEHLSQQHDAASRRSDTIDAHVAWLAAEVLDAAPSDVLDLACGPGLYVNRLGSLGHRCVGIDYSPASIDYATAHRASTCRFLNGDIRATEYGESYDLALLIFGELNVFAPGDARWILEACHRSLKPGGRLVVEPHTYAAVKEIGTRAPTWQSLDRGLFSDRPHLQLREAFWDASSEAATTRYFTIDAETGDVTRHASSMQAFTDEAYRALFQECGFDGIELLPGLGSPQPGLIAIVAARS